jgi:TonB family protein
MRYRDMMVPRGLVPEDVLPVAQAGNTAPGKRLYSVMDERIVVPAGLAVKPLDGHTNIPSHVPFDVLSPRLLIPRDMPIHPFTEIGEFPGYISLDVLDSRVVVPRDVEPAPAREQLLSQRDESAPIPPELRDVLEPDVLTTGEVTFLPEETNKQRDPWQPIARGLSIAFHIALICLIIWTPKMFETNVRTQEQDEIARNQLNFLYLPPSLKEAPRGEAHPPPPSDKMRVDPELLRKLEEERASEEAEHRARERAERPAPSEQPPAPVQPQLQPQPVPPKPVPQPSIANNGALPRQPSSNAPTANSLALPNLTPGASIQQSMQQALQGKGSRGTYSMGGGMPQGPGGGGSGAGEYQGTLQVLTPTDGVDFTDYFQRLVASVRRNWYAIIPESARMGDKGVVYLQFRIMTDGSVPSPEPDLIRSSGKEPLDRAALSAIHASNPFEPLPPAFKRPYIELRFGFYYNLPVGSQ